MLAMLCSSRGTPVTRHIDFSKQAGKSMLVNMLGDVLVSEMFVQDCVVQAACLGRWTFLAVQGPLIGRVLSLFPGQLILQDVIHSQQETFFVLSFREV